MIKESIQEEDVITVNIYAANIGAPQYIKKILTCIKEETDSNTVFSSVAQSCLTLWPHESHHARPPCPSPTPRVYSNSCPSSQWCHPAISSSLCRPLLLLPPIPPNIRVFSSESTLCMRWPKYWSFSFSISPSNNFNISYQWTESHTSSRQKVNITH